MIMFYSLNLSAAQPYVTDVSSNTANGVYNAGEVIDIRVTFNEAVFVTMTPQITLETGASDAVVNYTSGSASNSLVFNYTVAASHESPDLDYRATDSLTLNGATIKNAAEENAMLALPTPGAAGSLGANKDLVIDTMAPNAPTVSGTTPTSDTTPTWSWTSGGGGNGTFRYKLDDSNLNSGATETTGTSFTPGSPLSDGSHSLFVQERDAVGNWSTSGSKEIVIDVNDAPVLSNLNYTLTTISEDQIDNVGTLVSDIIASGGGGAIPQAERDALIVLYNSTNGDAWSTKTGRKTPPLHTDGFALPGTEVTWVGITVSGLHVTQVSLSNNHLVGTLPSQLGNLSSLQNLDLWLNQLSGAWVKLATPATLVTAGDLDGDGRGDVIGIWPGQGGVWVKYSQSGSWARLSSTARHIAAGLMRGGAGGSTTLLAEPLGGAAEGPGDLGYQDLAAAGPGAWSFPCLEEKNLTPQQDVESELQRVPGPGEYGFQYQEQKKLVPGSEISKEQKDKGQRQQH